MRLYYSLLGLSILIGLAGQSLLKLGMRQFGQAEIASTGAAAQVLIKAALSWPVLTGAFLYAAGFGAWLLVLTKIEVSVAYPMLSINYILITLVAWLFLGEPINVYKIAGCMLIMAGVVVLSRGAPSVSHPATAVDPPVQTESAPVSGK